MEGGRGKGNAIPTAKHSVPTNAKFLGTTKRILYNSIVLLLQRWVVDEDTLDLCTPGCRTTKAVYVFSLIETTNNIASTCSTTYSTALFLSHVDPSTVYQKRDKSIISPVQLTTAENNVYTYTQALKHNHTHAHTTTRL